MDKTDNSDESAFTNEQSDPLKELAVKVEADLRTKLVEAEMGRLLSEKATSVLRIGDAVVLASEIIAVEKEGSGNVAITLRCGDKLVVFKPDLDLDEVAALMGRS